jgi:hypothetical protein
LESGGHGSVELPGRPDRLAARSSYPVLRYRRARSQSYAEPLVSLDLDLVVAVDQMPEVEELLATRFHLERFPHSLNVSEAGSQLRVQIQTDPRYFDFPSRAAEQESVGLAPAGRCDGGRSQG